LSVGGFPRVTVALLDEDAMDAIEDDGGGVDAI
jgi:hypothetical protein